MNWLIYGKKNIVLKGTATLMINIFLLERALWTMNFDTSIIKIGWKMGKLWAFKEFNMPTFSRHFEYLISFQNFFNCLIFSYQ